MDIVTVTLNPSIDLSFTVGQVVPDKKLRSDRPTREPGGGGVNVARAVRKLGGEALALMTLGGASGRLLENLLEEEEIPRMGIPIRAMSRENMAVTEESSGSQYRFVLPGPTMTEDESRECLKAVRELDPPPAFIVASGSLPEGVPGEFYAELADLGRDVGARVILDSSGEPFRRAVERGVYLIKPNMRELRELTGSRIEGEEEMEEACRAIIRGGKTEVVVVSLGAGGAFMASADGARHLRAPTVPIRSKVGAGDSMVAGMVLALSRGRPIRDAVRFGVAAGAAAVMTPGSELCRRQDAERIFGQMTE